MRSFVVLSALSALLVSAQETNFTINPNEVELSERGKHAPRLLILLLTSTDPQKSPVVYCTEQHLRDPLRRKPSGQPMFGCMSITLLYPLRKNTTNENM